MKRSAIIAVILHLLSIKACFCLIENDELYDMDFKQLSQLSISSASKSPEIINEIPKTIFIITEADIKVKGYLTIEEALSDLPGFQFRNIEGFNSYIFQRGIYNQNNLILLLVDGVQINELNSGGFYAGGLYNLANIERIEVISGPAYVAYGTNAMTGIINIITKNPKPNRFRLTLNAGSFGAYGADCALNYLSEDKTFGARLTAMFNKTEKTDLKGAAGDYNWTDSLENFEDNYSIDLKLNYKKLIFGASYLNKQSSMATYIKSAGTEFRDYGTLWNIRFFNSYVKYNIDINSEVKLNSTLYFRDATVLDNSIMYVVDTAQIGVYRPNWLLGLENVFTYNPSQIFTLVGGLTLETESLSNGYSFSYSTSPDVKPPQPTAPSMNNNTLGSIFIEPRLNLFECLYISGGFRYDNSSVYNNVVTPNFGVSWRFNENTLRFSYSSAFRAPKPWDYTDGLGNSSLEPERMKSLEAALTLNLVEHVKADFIYYHNLLDNAFKKSTDSGSYRWVNAGEIATNGFETSVSLIYQKLKASVNYTYTDSQDESGIRVPEIAMHSANASISYNLTEHLSINFRANYLGERKNPKLISSTNSFFIEPAIIFHGALSLIEYYGITAQFIVKNIFDTEYYHTSNRPPDRYRQPERSFYFVLGYAFEVKD
jgi:vitamin B12 transporter